MSQNMLGNNLFQEVLWVVEKWRPTKAYDHERHFQKELQDYLDAELNESGDSLGFGPSQERVVSRERGKSNADIVVDDRIGVELKRDLTNSQEKKLRGQVEDYLDSYKFVIVVACGVRDMDGWRRLKNKLEGERGFQGGVVKFLRKKEKNYGKEPGGNSDQSFGDFGI